MLARMSARLVVSVFACGLALACTSSSTPAASAGEPAKPNEPSKPPEAATPEPDTTSAEPTGEPEPSGVAPVDGFFMAEGAPQPRACAVASDCHGDTIPDLDQPCCQNPRTLEPYSRAYKKWLVGWRTEHCADVTCPPPPAPSMPPDCAFVNDCVEGVCVDTCP